MRKYLFGTGIISAATSGLTLLRGMREQQFTWRTALAWLSWLITLSLAIGSIVETRKQSRNYNYEVPEQSAQEKKALKRLR